MNEILKLIGDYGIIIVVFGGLILLFVKYIPTLMNIWIERLKTKNNANDLILETVKNNTHIIENNSKVIENNTSAMNRNTNQYEKVNESLARLNESICTHDKRAENIAKDVAIIKERE